MQSFQSAMAITTAHGLPRMVTDKPIHVRLAWLMAFLIMTALFFKGFYEFVVKLQANQVTNSLEANTVPFQFPDVYMCFENSVSGSYSANIDAKLANDINANLNASREAINRYAASVNLTGDAAKELEQSNSFLYPHSIQYTQLINALAHRLEQSVITSQVAYNADYGTLEFPAIEPTSFYHPIFLRCMKWKLNDTMQRKIVQTGSSSGIITKIMLDGNLTDVETSGSKIQPLIYIDKTAIPISDWTLFVTDFEDTDRSAGVKVFLTSPGEYPSDYVTSFSLGPGKFHSVAISMIQQEYKEGQFDCFADPPEVQFVNPYDQTPYTHSYSYSYCYYYEYHKVFQTQINMSGDVSPLPWPLRGKKYYLNLTGLPNFFIFADPNNLSPEVWDVMNKAQKIASSACNPKRPCSTLDYSVSISSSDWPTQSPIAPFINSAVRSAAMSAKARNQRVPALDFLMTANASRAASYLRNNMFKVHFKPHRVMCDKVTFSKDYGATNFISDVGGIMGVYLGMSLLTMCELLELFYDLLVFAKQRNARSQPSVEKATE